MTSKHEPGDYLWDRGGPVDAEVAGLERLLAPQRWRGDARHGGRGRSGGLPVPAPRHRRTRRWPVALAAVATLALLAIGARLWYGHRLDWPVQQPWQVALAEGEVRIDGREVAGEAQLAPGAVLATGDGRVRLRAARIGEVVVGEGSRFRIVTTGGGRHRTELQHGRLWARVWAPPGAFGVSTPAGDVFDLGCEFVLDAREDGSGALTVRSGWVQIDNRWREVLVPRGARVEFGAGGRPGTPFDLGASDRFLAALRALDVQPPGAEPDPEAVRALVAASRPQDAISLLSLLQARPQLVDGPVFDRLAALMPADARVTRAALRERGAHALSPWWNALPYPRMKRWWMHWPDAFGARDDAGTLLRMD